MSYGVFVHPGAKYAQGFKKGGVERDAKGRVPNSDEERKTITIFSKTKTLYLLNGVWKNSCDEKRKKKKKRKRRKSRKNALPRRRSKFETVKIPKSFHVLPSERRDHLSYPLLIPLPLHVRCTSILSLSYLSLSFLSFSTYTRLFVRQIRLTTCPVYPIRRTTTRTRSRRSRSACRTTRAWNRDTRPRTAGGGGSSAR